MNKSVTKNDYIYSADILRSVAILLVICIHIATSFVDYPPYFKGTSWWIANFVNAGSRIAVPLFIMLSGYLLLDVKKTDSGTTGYKKRLSRILIPTVIWSILYLLWSVFFWFKTPDVTWVFSSLFAGGAYYHLYFLYIIIGLYVLLPVLQLIRSRLSESALRNAVILLFCYVTLIHVINYVIPDAKTTFTALTLFFPYISYFFAGSYLKTVTITKQRAIVLFGLFIFLVFATGVLNYVSMNLSGWSNEFKPDMNYGRFFYDYFSPNIILMAVLFFLVMLQSDKLFPFLKKPVFKIPVQNIAKTSFGIFLIHPIVIDVIGRYTNLNLADIGGMIWLYFFVKILLVFIFSFGIVIILKKFIPKVL